MSLINVTDLTFAYEGSYDNIFENASFQMDTNWKLGFIGRNGRGKTTFLNILLGKYRFSGSVTSSVGFEYFPFPVADDNADTIAVVDEICKNYQYWELLRELSLLNVSEDVLYRPFKTLSNGERTKVLLAALFLQESKFLLIDEPTNHLDMQARAIVSRYLNAKKGFILVSHDRAFLDGCVDHILSINRSSIEVQQGNFSSWFCNKQQKDNFEFAQNSKLKREIKRLEKTAAEKADWSDKLEKTKYGTRNSGLRPDRGYIGHKAAKMMKRSKAIEERQGAAVKQKSQLLKDVERADSLKLSPLVYHSQKYVTLDNVNISYGDKAVCRQVSFEVEKGARVALCGKNGCGKSSLLKLVCGEKLHHSGRLQVGSGLKISYVAQDTSFLCGGLDEFARKVDVDVSLFKAILRKLDFQRVQFDKPMEHFSAGQKKKVLIAKSLCEQAHLYIWDEPLNYIDVLSRMQIEQLICEFQPTMLFVEHDSEFVKRVGTRVVEL